MVTNNFLILAGIESILTSSEDYDELLYVWEGWRNATGAKMRDLYKIYVELSNEAAVANSKYTYLLK